MFDDEWGWADGTREPAWVPRVQTLGLPCGQYFDAVRADADTAASAHAILGPHSGPVLANSDTRTWFFLLEPGAVAPGSWKVRGSRLLRPGTVISVPPAFITTGRDVRWVILPGFGTTRPDDLRAALDGRTPPPPAPHRRARRTASLPIR
ncbi:hypothetical protein ACFV3R_10455 [Streptomyces sp. NPDC059740]|uniref:hypothetical protein n=1 Tax=Streptomyces sp. NPDC059740 TaxID=3346926 RepID=UPI00364C1170